MSSNFNPRSPHGERREPAAEYARAGISIHAPRTGSDALTICPVCNAVIFQSTLPARGATGNSRAARGRQTISIHAPRTGSDACIKNAHIHIKNISIHAPRTGSDDDRLLVHQAAGDFNPRSPHGERRDRWQLYNNCKAFQSTLPARGATTASNPQRGSEDISIHAPRTGSDEIFPVSSHVTSKFQSTLPARGATEPGGNSGAVYGISIHAPRTGSDGVGKTSLAICMAFQSTLPARGATESASAPAYTKIISIHAPRTGSDCAK